MLANAIAVFALFIIYLARLPATGPLQRGSAGWPLAACRLIIIIIILIIIFITINIIFIIIFIAIIFMIILIILILIFIGLLFFSSACCREEAA